MQQVSSNTHPHNTFGSLWYVESLPTQQTSCTTKHRLLRPPHKVYTCQWCNLSLFGPGFDPLAAVAAERQAVISPLQMSLVKQRQETVGIELGRLPCTTLGVRINATTNMEKRQKIGNMYPTWYRHQYIIHNIQPRASMREKLGNNTKNKQIRCDNGESIYL